jgi:signal transduction histidine kinase
MKQRLHVKIAVAVLISTTLISIVSSVWQYATTRRDELDNAHRVLAQLAATVQTSAAIAAYLDNKEIAADVVQGLTKNDIVAVAKLNSVTGLEIFAGTQVTEHAQLAPVIYGLQSPFAEMESVGQLAIIPKHTLIQARAGEAARKQAIIMGLNTFVVAWLVMLVVYRLLIGPINKLSADLSAAAPGKTVAVDIPRGHEHDEIGSLTEDANRLLANAKQLLDAERTMQEELLRHRERLEELVCQRTAELQAETFRAESASRAKSEFLSLMSHELRTPLNAIIGYGQLLEYELQSDGNPERIDDLNRITTASRHLLSIIESVLELSQLEEGDSALSPEEFFVAGLRDELVDLTAPLIAQNNNRLIAECDDVVMLSDRQKLKQILLNLIGNAAKFSKNSDIKLSITTTGNNYVLFAVTDHGIGISEEKLSSLFQPFTQADNSSTREFGGTGLGLYLGKRYAEMLKGSIAVQSRVGAGSTFTVCLPRIN